MDTQCQPGRGGSWEATQTLKNEQKLCEGGQGEVFQLHRECRQDPGPKPSRSIWRMAGTQCG